VLNLYSLATWHHFTQFRETVSKRVYICSRYSL